MKNIRRFFGLFLSILLISGAFMTVNASESENGIAAGEAETTTEMIKVIPLKIDVSSELPITREDSFVLTIKDSDGDEREIMVNAYECYYEPKEVELPNGRYEVTGIRYAGKDKDIKKGCYAFAKEFIIEEGITVTKQILIGEIQIASMKQEDLLIMKNGKQEESIDPYATETTMESSETEEETEATTVEKPSTEEISTEELKEDPDSEEVVEVVEKEKEKKHGNKHALFIKGIPILVIMIIGSIAIFIYGRKQKE